jgi:non-specific serine/threonine protein kinase
MGEVHVAEDTRLGRRVALKLLTERIAEDAQARARFEREAKAAASLNHPGVVTLHSFEEIEGTCLITMELVEGEPLSLRVREGGLPLSELLDIGTQLSDAVAAAHQLGIVHRDLKPANVMTTPDGRVKVLDFGLARLEPEATEISDSTLASDADAGTTRAGQVLGSAAYMAPEQAEGRPVDARADLWSLGVLLFELATGRRPFQGATFAALSAAVLRDEPPSLSVLRPDLPEELDAILRRLLEKQPASRLESAVALRELLVSLRGDSSSSFSRRVARPAVPGNLPRRRTSFHGRERALKDLATNLEAGALLTLTGVGGCGKTRLAVELASRARDEYPGGAWIIELAALSEPAQVVPHVARTLELRDEPATDHESALLEHLRERSLLLVLDNCEHLLAECARLADVLLETAPGLALLATSREGLGVAGETLRQVGSLTLPRPAATLEQAQDSESMQLLLERARSVRAAFALDADNLGHMVAICQRLDGIPLALELAAARLKALSPQQVANRLDDTFKLLTGGSRTALERHQTLRATLDWSYELLSPPEQSLYRRLAVFVGGWTLALAESTCSGEGLDESEIIDQLMHLVDRSLVMVENEGDEPRYRFLEPVRQHARDLLTGAGEAESARDHHLTALAEWSKPFGRAVGDSGVSQGGRLRAESGNVQAALTHALQGTGTVGSGLDLFSNCTNLWTIHGCRREGIELGQALLGRPEAAPRDALRAWALLTLARAETSLGRRQEALEKTDEALAIAPDCGDAELEFYCYYDAASTRMSGSETDGILELLERAREIARQTGSELRELQVSIGIGNWHWLTGDLDATQHSCEAALELARRQGSEMGIAVLIANLGSVAYDRDDFGQARELMEEALGHFRALDHVEYVAWRLVLLAQIACRQGRDDDVTRMMTEAEQLIRSFGSEEQALLLLLVKAWFARRAGNTRPACSFIRGTLRGLAALGPARFASAAHVLAHQLAAMGQAGDAARFSGAFGACLDGRRDEVSVDTESERRALQEGLKETLGAEGLAAARAEGAAWSLEQACEQAERLLATD